LPFPFFGSRLYVHEFALVLCSLMASLSHQTHEPLIGDPAALQDEQCISE